LRSTEKPQVFLVFRADVCEPQKIKRLRRGIGSLLESHDDIIRVPHDYDVA
jgi:hypothetical protein